MAYSTVSDGKIAIFYEHPEWFKPLFAELDRRGVSSDRVLAHQHRFDPTETRCAYALVVNRMSPSAYLRGHGQAIPYTLQYMAHLKDIGANVLNGYDAYVYEFSKARQIGLLHRLGLHPRSRVINHPWQAVAAAEGLAFPVILKPNIGGSGAKIVRFDSLETLRAAAEVGALDLGPDGVALVQEYLPAEGNSIVRVEVLNGAYLYAIRLYLSTDEFNLCPADYCRMPEREDGDSRMGRADGVSGRGVPIEGFTPPHAVIQDVLRIIAAAHIEVGGVEYLVNSRDGRVTYYDVNALSNFVANAPKVIGFDPFPLLVDYLMVRAEQRSPVGV